MLLATCVLLRYRFTNPKAGTYTCSSAVVELLPIYPVAFFPFDIWCCKDVEGELLSFIDQINPFLGVGCPSIRCVTTRVKEILLLKTHPLECLHLVNILAKVHSDVFRTLRRIEADHDTGETPRFINNAINYLIYVMLTKLATISFGSSIPFCE